MVGTRTETIIKPSPSALLDLPAGELRDVFSDGIVITQELYDVAYNDSVEIPEAPSGNIKSLSSFEFDFQRTELYREIETLVDTLTTTTSDPNPFTTEDDGTDYTSLTPEQEAEIEEIIRSIESEI